jgi:hypothetical protein
MDEKQRGIILGSLIILVGLLILLSNLEIFNFSGRLTSGGAILLVGITFISFYLNETKKFALLIVGEMAGTLGLALVFGSLEIIPFFYREEISWIIILWGGSTVFCTIFLNNRGQLWSLLPGGFLFTTGLLVLASTFSNFGTGNLWVLFLVGLSFTFGLIFLFSPNKPKSGWAKFLAIILLAVALFIFYLSNLENFITKIIFPILLILAGSYYIYQSFPTTKITK